MTRRTRIEEPRRDGVREWEAFARDGADTPLRHVGSITAPSAETAHERAGSLFPDAATVWLCPSEEVARFTERTLGEASHDEVAEGETKTTPTAERGGVDP